MLAKEATAASAANSTRSPHDTDQTIVTQWLAQRPPTTTRSYRAALRYLPNATDGIELCRIRLPQLQAFAQRLRGLQVSSQVTFIAGIQSLFSFAYKVGYLPTNPALLLKRPRHTDNISKRIVDE